MQTSNIEQNLESVKKHVAVACQRANRSLDDVTIIAVSKTQPYPMIATAFDAGVMHFGENRVQEAQEKIEKLSHINTIWHLIGHLQTNKVKTAVQLFDIIHSVDSVRLAEVISRQADNEIEVLLQVNVAQEETKGGFTVAELPKALKTIGELPNIKVQGLMTIAPWISDPEEVRPVFKRLRELRDSLRLKHLSMGMTDDYEVAIEEGATMVRIGRAIFGARS
ncbi:YggS family pyridoxal phosphate-dependent enzyme [Chloroflexota bacterium]